MDELKNKRGISAIWVIIIVLGILFIAVACSDTTNNNGSSYISSSSSNSTLVTNSTVRESYSTYIAKCSTIDYTTLSRSPNSYVGNNYKFTGEVFQVISEQGNKAEYLVDVTLKR